MKITDDKILELSQTLLKIREVLQRNIPFGMHHEELMIATVGILISLKLDNLTDRE